MHDWIGKFLIYSELLRFNANAGEDADIEHMQTRSLGGMNDLHYLDIAHRKCNGEKGSAGVTTGTDELSPTPTKRWQSTSAPSVSGTGVTQPIHAAHDIPRQR